MDKKNVNIRGNVISVGNGLQAYAEIKLPNNDKPKLIEMGTLMNIAIASQRDMAAVHKNGNSETQTHDKGTRRMQGQAIWATLGVKPITSIYNALKDDKDFDDYFNLGDLDAEEMGAGTEDLDKALKNFTVAVKEDEKSISLMDLPIINIVLLAKADVIRKVDLDEMSKKEAGISTVQTVSYNTILTKRITGISFISASSGMDGKTGFENVTSTFLVLGKNGPWKKVNE